MVEYPPQLTRYINLRRHLSPVVFFIDEREPWMTYLLENLELQRPPFKSLWLAGKAPMGDEFWLSRHERQGPTMRLTASQRRRLRAQVRDRPRGWTTAGERIIADAQRSGLIGAYYEE
jgi:hypothetical protein